MKTQTVSAGMEAIGKNVKPVAKKVINHLKENKSAYAIGTAAAYVGATLLRDLRGDSVEIGHFKQVGVEPDTLGAEIGRPTGYIPQMEWTNEPTLLQKLQTKVKDAFSTEFKNPPEWVDPTQPYLMDSKGNFLTDDWGIIVNPWYNKELAEKVNSQAFGDIFRPSMEKFLGNTAESVQTQGLNGFKPMMDIDGHPVLSYDGNLVPDFQGTGIAQEVLESAGVENHIPDMAERVMNALQEFFDHVF